EPTAHPPGGYSARFLGIGGPQTLAIQVESPTQGFAAEVYSAGHELLGVLSDRSPLLDLEGVDGDFYVTVAMAQNGQVRWADDRAEVRVRINPGASMCTDEGASCGGSGPAFDDQCCGDLICVVGNCREPAGREGDACGDEVSCALGLRCAPVGEADAASCCARDGDYCADSSDCCGLQECSGGRCVGRTIGQTCRLGDCVGTGFCAEGLCSDGS
ncbi:MAG: hypothetical protein AAGF12_42055, partial [Myxococcota bacterium]